MNKEIELLHNKIEAQDKIINTQALEIAGLKSIIEKWELGVFSNDEELKQRIDKAIEYIKFEWQEIIGNENYSNHLWTIDGLVIKRLLKILGEKENE